MAYPWLTAQWRRQIHSAYRDPILIRMATDGAPSD